MIDPDEIDEDAEIFDRLGFVDHEFRQRREKVVKVERPATRVQAEQIIQEAWTLAANATSDFRLSLASPWCAWFLSRDEIVRDFESGRLSADADPQDAAVRAALAMTDAFHLIDEADE